MKKLFLFLVIVLGASQFTFSQSKKELKEQKAQEDYQAIKDLVSSKKFIFDATWISTQRGQRINIAAGSNSIEIVQDSTKAAMQFFGEVTSIRFSGREGVKFDNKMENYQVQFNDKKKRVIVSYNVKNKAENYSIYMSINNTGYAYVDVYSNNKSGVTYDGNVFAIKE